MALRRRTPQAHRPHGDAFVVSGRWQVFILLLGPLIVFLAGLSLAVSAGALTAGASFLPVFSGLVLCVGAVLVYAVLFARHACVHEPILDRLSSRRTISPHSKLSQLSLFFSLFLIAWAIQSALAPQNGLLVLAAMFIFGMLYVTLAAHFHSRH